MGCAYSEDICSWQVLIEESHIDFALRCCSLKIFASVTKLIENFQSKWDNLHPTILFYVPYLQIISELLPVYIFDVISAPLFSICCSQIIFLNVTEIGFSTALLLISLHRFRVELVCVIICQFNHLVSSTWAWHDIVMIIDYHQDGYNDQ